MSKYGLNLRPNKNKQPSKPPLPTPFGFGNDDDNDVEREISRHASKKKSLKDIEAQQKKALEEDPSVFDYDGVYDEMKKEATQPRVQDRQERKPKYILGLLKKTEERKREQDIVYERKLEKERKKDDHLYADKDKFVTSAYKKKLAEQAKWMEEERLRKLREEKEDVTKKTDLSDFYFNLGKNVAFGSKDAELRKQEKQDELRKAEKHGVETHAATLDKNGSSKTSNSISESSRVREEHRGESFISGEEHQGETSISRRSESSEVKTVSNTTLPGSSEVKPTSNATVPENFSVQQPPAEQPKTHDHKRSEDAVAAAKERFLARKRAKEQ